MNELIKNSYNVGGILEKHEVVLPNKDPFGRWEFSGNCYPNYEDKIYIKFPGQSTSFSVDHAEKLVKLLSLLLERMNEKNCIDRV